MVEKRKRDPLDRYYTPKWVVDLCRTHILQTFYGDLDFKSILDPGAGKGAFTDGFRAEYPNARIVGVDVDPDVGPWESADESYEGDFLEMDFSGLGSFDLVGGNPPFKQAQPFVETALGLTGNVVYLLRLNFLAGGRRRKSGFWPGRRPDFTVVMPNRPPFLGGSDTDATEYSFLCWREDRPKNRAAELHWFPDVPKSVRIYGEDLMSIPQFAGKLGYE